MDDLSAAQAAEILGVSPRRVQQLVKSGRLPAEMFGGSLLIKKKDLALVADRKPGRPAKSAKARTRKQTRNAGTSRKRRKQ